MSYDPENYELYPRTQPVVLMGELPHRDVAFFYTT